MPTSTHARDRSTPRTRGDPVAQRADLVADAAHAAGAEVGEVLAQPGGVHPGGRGQLTGGDGAPAAVGQGLSTRRYTARRATVASGMVRGRGWITSSPQRSRRRPAGAGRGTSENGHGGRGSPASATVTACERRNKVAGQRGSALTGPYGCRCGGDHPTGPGPPDGGSGAQARGRAAAGRRRR